MAVFDSDTLQMPKRKVTIYFSFVHFVRGKPWTEAVSENAWNTHVTWRDLLRSAGTC